MATCEELQDNIDAAATAYDAARQNTLYATYAEMAAQAILTGATMAWMMQCGHGRQTGTKSIPEVRKLFSEFVVKMNRMEELTMDHHK